MSERVDGGSPFGEGVVPGPCSWPGLGLTCVAGVPGGVRSIRQKPKGVRSIRVLQARGRSDG
jgi:hypothetical protein